MSRKRAATWIKRAALALGALAGLYLAAANLLLLTGWAEHLLSPRPERFRMSWQSGWTLWPGRVQLRGVELRGASPRTVWDVSIDRAGVVVDLSDLFSRTVRFTRLDTAGISFHTKRRETASQRAPRTRRNPWTIETSNAELSAVRVLEIHGLRLAGEGRASGGFRIVTGRTFELFETTLSLPGAMASSRGRELAQRLDVAAQARIAPYEVGRFRGAAVYDFVSGSLSVAGDLVELPLAAGGSGRIGAAIRLQSGALAPPSRVTLTGEGLGVRLAVEADRLVLDGFAKDLRLGRLRMAQLDGETATPERRLSRLLARSWRAAAPQLPLDFTAREIEVAAPQEASWSLAATEAKGRVDLAALLRRELRLVTLAAEGVAADWSGWHLDGTLAGQSIEVRLTPKALEQVSGSLTVAARVAAPEWLTRTVPESRSAKLAAELQVRQGTVAPGSRASFDAGSKLTVSAEAEATGLALRAEGRALTLSGPAASVTSGTVSLSARTTERRLARLASGAVQLPPAQLDARDLVWQAKGDRLAHKTALTRATAKLDLAGLGRREVLLTGLSGRGLSVRLDLLRERAAASREPSRWSVSIPRARLAAIRDVSLGDLRLEGPATAGLSLASSPEQGLSLTEASLALPKGKLSQRGESLADPLSIEVDLELAPIHVAGSDADEILRHLEATCEVEGRISSLGFLERWVKRQQLLDLAGGGELRATARLERGRLLTGSRVEVTGTEVRAGYLDHQASGSARITGRIDKGPKGDVARILVAFDEFGISADGGEVLVTGRGLTLSAVSPDVDLTQPVRSLNAEVRLEEGDVLDLSDYNRYLPDGLGIGIVSGRGKVGFRLQLDPIARTGRGEVKLQAQNVTAQMPELELDGDLAVQAKLDSSDLLARRFDLSGSRLSLTGMTVRGEGEDIPLIAPGWWARLELDRANGVWERPLTLSGSARLTMRDPGLLVVLFAERKKTLGWLAGLLDVRNVTAQGEIRLADGELSIDPLHATSGKLDLRSRLLFGSGRRRGDLLVRWGRLAAGIELRDGERDWKLRRPEEWFERSTLGSP